MFDGRQSHNPCGFSAYPIFQFIYFCAAPNPQPISMNAKPIVKTLFTANGALFIIVGTSVILYRTPLLTDGMREIMLKVVHGDLNALHLLQEFSSLMIGVGILSFWAVQHYEQSKTFHIALTTFWGLLALIHWFDVRGPWHSITGPIINTIPFVLFLLAGLARRSENS